MNYKKLFGYGALIWVVAYIAAILLVVLRVGTTMRAGPLVGIVAAAMAAWAGTQLERTSIVKILFYSLGWVIVGLVLDLILTIPFTGWQFYFAWSYWASYVLIAVLPIFTSRKTMA